MHEIVLLTGAVLAAGGMYILTKEDNEKITKLEWDYYKQFPGYFQLFFSLIDPQEEILRIDTQQEFLSTQYLPIIKQFHSRMYTLQEDSSLFSNVHSNDMTGDITFLFLDMIIDEFHLTDASSNYFWVAFPRRDAADFQALLSKVYVTDFAHSLSKCYLEFQKDEYQGTYPLTLAVSHLLKCLFIDQIMGNSPILVGGASLREEYNNLSTKELKIKLGEAMVSPLDVQIFLAEVDKLAITEVQDIVSYESVRSRIEEQLENYVVQDVDNTWKDQEHAFSGAYTDDGIYTPMNFGVPEPQMNDTIEDYVEMIDEYAGQLDSGAIDIEDVSWVSSALNFASEWGEDDHGL